MSVQIKEEGDLIKIYFPYHEDAKLKIKRLGAKWDGDCWTISRKLRKEVSETLIRYFGTDGASNLKTVDVELKAKIVIYGCCEPVSVLSKIVSRATGRDSGAYAGHDVALLSGTIKSGGSAKNWKTIVKEGTVFKLINVNKKEITDLDTEKWELISVTDDDESNLSDLIEEKNRLLVRITEIDSFLTRASQQDYINHQSEMSTIH